MTAAVGARNLFKVDAGVVHALLQARYQNSSRGQFISEDPVFLGNARQQILTDSDTLNSYSYANDNPIVHSDPTVALGTAYKRKTHESVTSATQKPICSVSQITIKMVG